jgi:diaminohydroxyphosphoribosylaminopyrimidine deaminase/5-amino-6-(5-phosphoribosylamino)uracil reductase
MEEGEQTARRGAPARATPGAGREVRVATAADERFMARALELAARGRWTVSPNPMVGCVVVADGEVVGEGWHERAGGPHAEVAALRAAAHAARGATVYVTLEPCAHTGRTGPCTHALRDAGVARVVAAMPDPNPDAAGGAEQLRAAGVTVELGVRAAEARALNDVFVVNVTRQRPHVTLKAAVSVDGRIAAEDATSQWLTGEAARRRAHELRAGADAVVGGAGTVLADDPQLTCRLPGYRAPQPLRVVLDRRGRVTDQHRVLDGAAPTLVVRDGGLDGLLARLWDRDVRSVLVEGGAAVISAFLRAGCWDTLQLHVAPLFLGERGRPLVVGDWPETLAKIERLALHRVEQLGPDAVLTLRRDEGED